MTAPISRRGLLKTGAVGGMLALSSGVVTAQTGGAATASPDFLAGTRAERQAFDLGLSDAGTRKNIRWFETDTGTEYQALADADDPDWQPISATQQRYISSASDLPDPVNGRHPLEDNTAYIFNGFVASQYGLELGTSTPLIGRHGSVDGFICTGGGPAVYARDSGFFARDLYVHAPGGTLFDLSATTASEILVESCAFSDAAGIADIASLGTIDGYRVPSFKGCNFEDFASGLTLDGAPDKIFFEGCPFRNINTTGVTMLAFAGTLDVDIVDMANNYVKGVQSDTEIIRVGTGASPTDVFQYRGTTHDGSVTTSNILNGEAGVGVVGYRVADSYPLRDSAVVGEVALDSPTDTTISTQNTYTQIEGATSLGNESERVTQVAPGTLRYDGKKNVNVNVSAAITVIGASNETYAVAVAKNGTVEPTSEVELEGTGNTPKSVTVTAIEDLTTGDTLSLHIKNEDGTSNATVRRYNLTFGGL